MSNLSNRIIQIILWVLMAVTIVFAVIFYFGNAVEGTEGTRLEEPVITTAFLNYAKVLLVITVAITVIFAIINVIINPKGIKVALVSIVVGAIIIVIAYLMADDTVLHMPHYDGKDNVPGTLKFIDTGLVSTYFLLGLAVLAIIYSSVSRLFK